MAKTAAENVVGDRQANNPLNLVSADLPKVPKVGSKAATKSKDKAEPKPKGSRSEDFGAGTGEHGQGGTVINNHYHNVGNINYGDQSGATVHSVGKGSIAFGSGAPGTTPAGAPVTPAGASATASSSSGSPQPKTRKPRTAKPASATPAASAPSPTGAAPRALGAGRQRPESHTRGSQTHAPVAARSALPAAQASPQGGAPRRREFLPLALGAAPEKAEDPVVSGKVSPKVAEPKKTRSRKTQPARAGEGVVIPGEVVTDETASVTKTKPPRKTQPTFIPRSEGGTPSGMKPMDKNEQFRNLEDRINSGADSPLVKVVAAAALKTPTTKPNLVTEIATRVSKSRPHDDAVPLPKAAAPSPSTTSVIGSAATIGTKPVSKPLGHEDNPHQGSRVTPKGRQVELSGDAGAKVEKGHHVEVNGQKYRVGSMVSGSDMSKWHVDQST